ncbi:MULTISPECIES: hypothetical protein [Rhizobium/Agrobacterium group]|nr:MULTISPECIES: hypothetical protein [Rhizobium/Agrobacterium group]KAB1082362.1 hypothetical protein F4V91_32405 [Neorhizobium galegae]OAP97611.1 hypothetical protein A4U53_36465 [Rhizobium leguminosarum]
MSTTKAKTSSGPATSSTPSAAAVPFELTATNGSSVPGFQYFSVFPPALKNPPPKSQVLTALVSDATDQAGTTTLTWNGGSGALALFALLEGTSPNNAHRTPVALGDTVAVALVDGAFTLTATAGGPANAIEVTFAPGVPPGGQIGLVVGPAPILVAIPAGLSSLTLEPDLSPTVTVVFGTAFQFPEANESDVSQSATTTFKQDATTEASPTAIAHIEVDLDNKITQVG